MDPMKTLAVGGKRYEVQDPNSISYEEPQNFTPEQQKMVREKIGAADQATISQGRSAKYTISTGGWKRILNIIRGTSGTVNMCLACNYPYRSTQILSFDFSGYVRYPDQKDGTKGDQEPAHPILIKRYENSFGVAGTESKPQAKITSVRICYPAANTSFPEKPESDYEHNPINCYVDVYIQVDKSKIIPGRALPEININFAGFADSHNCEAITEETDATDYGIYGEILSKVTNDLRNMKTYATSEDSISRDAINRDGNFPHYGLTFTGGGTGKDLRILPATTEQIDEASGACYNPIVPATAKYMVEKYTKGLDDRLSVVEGIFTWELIQKAVREGRAKEQFPVGTQFLVKNSLVGDFLYDVVAHDHFKSADDENAHTMTLMCHDIVPIADVPFDISEAFYVNETGEDLDGDYYFYLSAETGSWKKTYYRINSLQLKAGGKLYLKKSDGSSPSTATALALHRVYSDDGQVFTMNSMAAYGLDGYTPFLGTFGLRTSANHSVNYVGRICNGSNNYKSSVIREVVLHAAKDGLNGNQSMFDSAYNGECNFVDSFEPGFLAVVGKVIVPCDTCNTYEPYGTYMDSVYELEETFFLPSMQEITGESNGAGDKSAQLEYFKGTDAVDRIKRVNGVAQAYYTRSPYQPSAKTSAHTVRAITNKGEVSNFGVSAARGVVPMVNIVG